MTTQDTAFLGITLPVVGSQEPFRVADYNAAFQTVDTWAADVDTALGQADILEAALAAGTKPVAAAGITGTLPLARGGTGGTDVTTARAGLRIYVQSTQPSSPAAGDLWFW
jgi:hypothetical protein